MHQVCIVSDTGPYGTVRKCGRVEQTTIRPLQALLGQCFDTIHIRSSLTSESETQAKRLSVWRKYLELKLKPGGRIFDFVALGIICETAPPAV